MDPERFRRQLLRWYARYRRTLPWRETRDPYHIWVSEIMLQQTRVAAVIPYYTRFLERFPTIAALAAAPEQDVLAAWAGLGYYSRARNLHRAARQMAGAFPQNYDVIRCAPGIGDYTAAAIASIAFGYPHAAVDGNVIRVIARLTAETGDTSAAATRQRICRTAATLLDANDPGTFNQAMMELGATICVPRDPQCLVCPAAGLCAARRSGQQNEIPRKPARAESRHCARTLYLVTNGEALLLWRRPPEARKLAGFWDIPESTQLREAVPGPVLGAFRHSITNTAFLFTVVSASIGSKPKEFQWVPIASLRELPVTTVARKALRFRTVLRH
ncbi:MAG TPA: A/G-specific adenine glycosylase [Bryobacteraceae bacterium]|nr:A/G-specific adenine glycosylase [Bryobacteraceae bacterium]